MQVRDEAEAGGGRDAAARGKEGGKKVCVGCILLVEFSKLLGIGFRADFDIAVVWICDNRFGDHLRISIEEDASEMPSGPRKRKAAAAGANGRKQSSSPGTA